jgi:hypothetical protein
MNVMKLLGLAAVGGMLMLAAPAERAQALSLANPGAAAAVQQGSKVETTEVHGLGIIITIIIGATIGIIAIIGIITITIIVTTADGVGAARS